MRASRSLILAVLLSLSACHSWQAQPMGAVQLIDEQHPTGLRLSGQDGRQLTLERPFVRGDSVLGQTGRDTTGLALTEIDTVSVKRFDWAKTIGLVAVTSAAGMAVSALVLSDLGEIGFTFSE